MQNIKNTYVQFHYLGQSISVYFSDWNFFQFNNQEITFWCIDTVIPLHFLIFVTEFEFHAAFVCHFVLLCMHSRAVHHLGPSRNISQHLIACETKCHGGSKQQIMVNSLKYLKNLRKCDGTVWINTGEVVSMLVNLENFGDTSFLTVSMTSL